MNHQTPPESVQKLHVAVGMVVLTAAWCAALLTLRVLIS